MENKDNLHSKKYSLKSKIATSVLATTAGLAGLINVSGCAQIPTIHKENKVIVYKSYKNLNKTPLPQPIKDFLALPYNQKIKMLNPSYLKIMEKSGILDPKNMSNEDFVFMYTLHKHDIDIFLNTIPPSTYLN